MKDQTTCCSTSWKKKLLLSSIIVALLVAAVILSNQTATPIINTPVEVVPFSNGPSGPPSEMRLPESNPPETDINIQNNDSETE